MTGRTVVYALFFYSCEHIDLICSSSMLPLAAFSPFHILLLQNTQAGGDNSSASQQIHPEGNAIHGLVERHVRGVIHFINSTTFSGNIAFPTSSFGAF